MNLINCVAITIILSWCLTPMLITAAVGNGVLLLLLRLMPGSDMNTVYLYLCPSFSGELSCVRSMSVMEGCLFTILIEYCSH